MNPEQKLPHIMLIDDTPEDLYIYKRFIQKFINGISISDFTMAEEAIEFLKTNMLNHENLPDIILVDIHMPGMDGFGFLKEFSGLSEDIKAKCHVYVLSSSFDLQDIKRANEHAYSKGFIEKPLQKEKIKNIVLERMQNP